MNPRPVLVALLLLLCAQPLHAAEIRRQLLAEPESLDPQLITGSTDFDVVEDLFEGLTAQGADGSIIPGLAETWTVGPDRLSWTFLLRAGLTWSDGSALTASDFVWAMRRAVDPHTASPYAAALAPLRHGTEIAAGKKPPESLGVSAPDPRTLCIDLREPTPFLPGLLAQPIAYPLPHAAIEHWGAEWTRPGHLVSNGAFVLTNWIPQSELVLDRNQRYHDSGAVRLDRVRWILADDRRAALRRYRTGEIDTAALAAEDYAWAKESRAAELRSTPLLATRYLVVNMAHGELAKDERVREALSLAIDRDLLVERIDTRGQHAAWGFVPSGLPGYQPAGFSYQGKSPAERQDLARQLFAAARHDQPGPLKITLLIEHDDIDHRIASGIRAMWQDTLPVDVTIDDSEWRVFNAQFHQGNFEVALFGWYADYADAWNFLANWRSDAGPLNPGGYRSPTFDALLDRAKAADGPERLTILQAAERQLLADHPVIPVEFPVSQKLVSPRVAGWAADPFDMNLDRFLSVSDP